MRVRVDAKDRRSAIVEVESEEAEALVAAGGEVLEGGSRWPSAAGKPAAAKAARGRGSRRTSKK